MQRDGGATLLLLLSLSDRKFKIHSGSGIYFLVFFERLNDNFLVLYYFLRFSFIRTRSRVCSFRLMYCGWESIRMVSLSRRHWHLLRPSCCWRLAKTEMKQCMQHVYVDVCIAVFLMLYAVCSMLYAVRMVLVLEVLVVTACSRMSSRHRSSSSWWLIWAFISSGSCLSVTNVD